MVRLDRSPIIAYKMAESRRMVKRITRLDECLSLFFRGQYFQGLSLLSQFSVVGWLSDELAPIGLVGIFYPGWGRVAVWVLFGLSCLSLPVGAIDLRLLRNAGLFVMALALGALFSANPEVSLSGCGRIALGLCMFVPGVYLGWRLRNGYASILAPLLILLFGSLHFAFPVIYSGNLVFGFDQNPNIIGRGLTYGLLLLGVITAAAPRHFYRLVPGRHGLFPILLALDWIVLSALLMISNYRSGWLALCVFALLLILRSKDLARRFKIAFLAGVSALFVGLVALRDWKGFGYGSVGERLDLWTRALTGWFDQHLVFGAGFKSFNLMGHLYYYGDVTRTYRYPHNVIVEYIFSSGIFGLLVLVVFLLAQARVFWASGLRAQSPASRASVAALISVVIAGQLDMELASFSYIAALASIAGLLYSECIDPAPEQPSP